MKRSDLVGSEFDWFAQDAIGHISVFSSAGWGPVPDLVFERFEGQQLLEEHLCTLCSTTSLATIPEGPRAFLQKGIFYYDWHDTYGPYRRFSVPSVPIFVSDLNLPAVLAQSLISLPDCRFRDSPELKAGDIPAFTQVDQRNGKA